MPRTRLRLQRTAERIEAGRARLLGAHRRFASLLFHGAPLDALRSIATLSDDPVVIVPRLHPEHAEMIGARRVARCDRLCALSRYVWQQCDLTAETHVAIDGRLAVRIEAHYLNVDSADVGANPESATRHVLVARAYVDHPDAGITYTLHFDDEHAPTLRRDLSKDGWMARLRQEFWTLLKKGIVLTGLNVSL